MSFFRAAVIVLTQVPLLYFELGSRDMLGGFNQTDQGFGLMVGLFIVVPLINLAWLIVESLRAFKLTREVGFNKSLLFPVVALFFLFEAIAVDLYLLSHVRM